MKALLEKHFHKLLSLVKILTSHVITYNFGMLLNASGPLLKMSWRPPTPIVVVRNVSVIC
jgi:hypothetical protein